MDNELTNDMAYLHVCMRCMFVCTCVICKAGINYFYFSRICPLVYHLLSLITISISDMIRPLISYCTVIHKHIRSHALWRRLSNFGKINKVFDVITSCFEGFVFFMIFIWLLEKNRWKIINKDATPEWRGWGGGEGWYHICVCFRAVKHSPFQREMFS